MTKKPKEKPAPEIVSDLHLQEMAYGGETVARLPEPQPTGSETKSGEQVVFVTGGLPGETVEVQLYRRKKSFLKANVLKIQEPSLERREAPCPYFGVEKWPNCGGCQWQHASYEAQLSYKHAILRDQLIRLGGFVEREPPLLPIVPAYSAWGYRNNVEFQVDDRSGRPCFHRQNSIRLVPVESCHIAHPLITLAIEPLTKALQTHLASRVHQVTIRVGPVAGDRPIAAEEISALASYNADPDQHLAALERFTAVSPLEMALQPRPAIMFILRMLGEWKSQDLEPFVHDLQLALDRYVELTVLGEGRKRRLDNVGGGKPYLTEVLHNITYHIPPMAFFQSNSPMAAELVTHALAAFETAGLKLAKARILDIYCGVGTFALQMAQRGATVLGIEEYAGAVVAADENARLNHLEERCRFVAAKAEEYILSLTEEFDGVLIDPPRRGCDPALLESLLQTRPSVIVYVSCDPSTLARDLKILADGYELIQSQAIDMFPQTFHMESISVLKRK